MEEKVYHPGNPDLENGVEMLEGMNARHKVLRDFAFSKIAFTDGMKILDAGCGGGAGITELLKKSAGSHVDGVDYADTSMEVAAKTIASLLGNGAEKVTTDGRAESASENRKYTGAKYQIGERVTLYEADVRKLPFADDTYDLVTAVETTYFWEDIKAAFREIRRILKVHGKFAVIVEGSDPDAHTDWPDPDHNITIRRPEEYIDLFWKTGFGEIQVDYGEGDTVMVRGEKLANADGFRGSFT